MIEQWRSLVGCLQPGPTSRQRGRATPASQRCTTACQAPEPASLNTVVGSTLNGLRHQEFKEVPELSIWKVLGDEIIFSASTSNDRDTAILVHALRQALLVSDRRFWKKCGYHVKGCAWTVDFTNQNLQIEIPEVGGSADEHGGGYSDFIGPDVDVGFRLAKCADSRELILDLTLVETVL